MRLMLSTDTPFVVSEATMHLSNQEANQLMSVSLNLPATKGNLENIVMQGHEPHDLSKEEGDDHDHDDGDDDDEANDDNDKCQHNHQHLTRKKSCIAYKTNNVEVDRDLNHNLQYHENNPMPLHQEHAQSTWTSKCGLRHICVFCGSKSGSKDVYAEASVELGKAMVERKIGLVYGGGSCGLMGIISKVVHDGGCHVIGVLPKSMLPIEISKETFGELKVVDDMHARKTQMAELADAFIALPGGYGTLEELLEVITCSQLGMHDKPVGILNIDGYYDPLLELFDNYVKEGFITSKSREMVIHATTVNELLDKFVVYTTISNAK